MTNIVTRGSGRIVPELRVFPASSANQGIIVVRKRVPPDRASKSIEILLLDSAVTLRWVVDTPGKDVVSGNGLGLGLAGGHRRV